MTASLHAAERITISDSTVDHAAEVSRSSDPSLLLRTADGAETALPADVQAMLLHVLTSVAHGGDVVIGRIPEQLTSTVAAEMLGVSRPTLMKWAHRGEIDSFKVGSHTRFSRDEVLRMKELRHEQRSEAFEELRAFDAAHAAELDS